MVGWVEEDEHVFAGAVDLSLVVAMVEGYHGEDVGDVPEPVDAGLGEAVFEGLPGKAAGGGGAGEGDAVHDVEIDGAFEALGYVCLPLADSLE